MRRARRLFLAAAAGAMLLSNGQWRAARAAIIVSPFGASFRLDASAQGGGLPGVEDEVRLDVFPISTSFSATRNVRATETGNIGTAASTAAGSANESISLIDDVLTFQSSASFDTAGTFTLAGNQVDPFAAGGGSGSFTSGITITTSERQYEYSFSGQVGYAISGDTGTGASRISQAFISLGGGDSNLNLIESHISGSGSVPVSGSGTLEIGGGLGLDITLSTSAAFSGAESGGRSNSKGSFNFQLTLTPLPTVIRWSQPIDGSFQVANNWTGKIVPGAQDVALFDRTGTYTVQLDHNVTNRGLRANGAGVNVALDLNGFDYTLDEISVGGLDGDIVSMTFEDAGGPVVSVASVAAGVGRTQAAANGGTVRRLRTSLLKAGHGGTANVTIPISTTTGRIENSGTVNVRTANGSWNVTELTVGGEDTGSGALVISDGGKVVSDRSVLGENAGSIGVANIKGQGSNWDNQTLVVGERGKASLFISDQAQVSGHNIVIGEEAGSDGKIDVDAANLNQNPGDDLTIGSRGIGRLSVMNNSLVLPGLLAIGLHSTGDGVVTVSSQGLLVVSRSLFVGSLGDALLVVDGGTVKRIGPGESSIGKFGVLDVRDGHFHEPNELDVFGVLGINPMFGSASVGVNVQSPGRLSVGPGGILRGNGIIQGTVKVFTGGANQFGGTISPGNSPGTLTIDGDYEQTGGLLDIEIAGTAPGQFDVLKVMGNAAIGGGLTLEFIDGFAPRQGDVFMFLDVGGALSGAFAKVEIRNLLPGFQFDLRRDAGGLTMVALNDGVSVPEPGLAALLMLPVLIAVRYVRKRR